MKETKTTYWLLIAFGVLSIVVSIFYILGKYFNTYFISGILGVVLAATGIAYLRKNK
jgi:uncharacterized membrane protein HdeD (DUF308 family)